MTAIRGGSGPPPCWLMTPLTTSLIEPSPPSTITSSPQAAPATSRAGPRDLVFSTRTSTSPASELTTREAIISGFAEAAQAVGAGAGADAAADGFAAWMASTRRTWALVLDDLTDPADLENLWPAGPAGQVVITTRLSGDGLDGLTSAA